MKLSFNWIKKYVDLPENLTIEKLAYDLTMCTVEVEDAEDFKEKFAGLVVGKILKVEPHPDADKLRICTVDTGDVEPSIIVCGGINLSENQLVVVAKPGAWVRWHGEGEPVEIKPAKLRGVKSYGMICSSSEIGLSDLFPASCDGEITDLTSFDAPAGMPIAEALGLDDFILEIDNKSMTNRPDLWGHYGMARELAAIYGCELKPIEKVTLPITDGGLEVKIDCPERCSRYSAIIIENIENKPSPYELQSMLWRVGIRPINLPVDITNYVMLATGQPTHGFDKNHIDGAIHVRTASVGEELELLDNEVLELTTEDLVIADKKAPVALAGVMGGKTDSILPETTSIILEVANFHPLSIRRTSKRFDIRTEASARYEKGIDPQRVDDAVNVAVAMFEEYFPKVEFTGYVDNYPVKLEKAEVNVSLSFLTKRLGRELSVADVRKTLGLLGFKVENDNDNLTVIAPSWRSTGDISLPDDILEEVARLMGYENFEFVAPEIKLEHMVNQRDVDMERAIREYLAFRCEMQEIFTYPWIEDEYINAAKVDIDEMLVLDTPPAPDESHLRSTLIPGLLKSTESNLRYFDNFRIFELTQVFFNRNFKAINDTAEKLPEMARSLAGAFVGNDPIQLFREAKGVIEYMYRVVQMKPLTFDRKTKPLWAEDKLWLSIMLDDKELGCIGLATPKTLKDSGIKHANVVMFELNVEELEPLASRDNEFKHLSAYPLVDFDLSVVFDENVKWTDIERFALKTNYVQNVIFVEEYRSESLGDNKKSVTFRIQIGSEERTMTSEDIDTASKQVIKKMNKKLGGEIRGAK